MGSNKLSGKEYLDVLIEFKQDIRTNVNTPTSDVWQKISKKLNGRSSSKAIYTYVRKHPEIWIDLELHEDMFNRSKLICRDENEEDCDVCFTLVIHKTAWLKIKPQDEYKCHFQKGWTDVVYKLLLDVNETCECLWVFKDSYCGNNKVKITAKCKECRSGLICTGSYNDDATVTLACRVSKTSSDLHSGKGKRRLSCDRRKEFAMKLTGQPPVNIQRQVAKDVCKDDVYLRTVPTLEVLRKCKSAENKKQKVNIPNYKCPLDKLFVLEWTNPYQSAIHHISMDDFFMHYWTEEQLYLYNTYIKDKSKFPHRLLIDATGTVVEKLPRPYNNSSHHILLYSAVVHLSVKHGQIPVSQMLSEKQDTNTIVYWMKNFLKSGAKHPEIVVCDHSFALLGVICWCFNDMTLNSYIELGMNLLKKPSAAMTHPKVLIRIDFAHLVKMVTRWKCFKDKTKRFKEFYVRCIVLVVKSTCIAESESIIESLFVVCKSECVGHIDNKPVPAESHKRLLKNKIADLDSINIPENEDTPVPDTPQLLNNSSECDHHIKSNNSVSEWIQNIVIRSEAQTKHETDDDNAHYCPDLFHELVRFLKTFILWSATLNNIFGFGKQTESSSSVESYFNDLKHRSYKNKHLPMKIDQFFLHHFDVIQGMTTVASVEYKKTVTTKIDHNDASKLHRFICTCVQFINF